MSECVTEHIEKLSPDYKTIIMLSDLRARAGLKKELDNGCDFYSNEQGTLACDRKITSINPKMPD